MRLIYLLLVMSFLTPNVLLAHPGNTASDGCHYCRTNCDKWGVAWDQRHCHGGTPTTTRTNIPRTPTCPNNSYYSAGSCVCNFGYTSFNGSCVKIPANAHAISSKTDAWKCNVGYIELNGLCIKETVNKSASSTVSSTQNVKAENLSPEELESIKKYLEEIEKENSDNLIGSLLSLVAIFLGGFAAYKKIKT